MNKLFKEFFDSERSAGLILILSTLLSFVIANSFLGSSYRHFWHAQFLNHSIEFWINDGLMTVFFLLVGLEIEREMIVGELSDLRKSLLPAFAAVGGMLFPALIHFAFNMGTECTCRLGHRSGNGIQRRVRDPNGHGHRFCACYFIPARPESSADLKNIPDRFGYH